VKRHILATATALALAFAAPAFAQRSHPAAGPPQDTRLARLQHGRVACDYGWYPRGHLARHAQRRLKSQHRSRRKD